MLYYKDIKIVWTFTITLQELLALAKLICVIVTYNLQLPLQSFSEIVYDFISCNQIIK